MSSRVVKMTVSVPAALARAIDRLVDERGWTRSGAVQHALKLLVVKTVYDEGLAAGMPKDRALVCGQVMMNAANGDPACVSLVAQVFGPALVKALPPEDDSWRVRRRAALLGAAADAGVRGLLDGPRAFKRGNEVANGEDDERRAGDEAGRKVDR